MWCDDAGAPAGFQLCYDKTRSEHALTWKPELGYVHKAVDDGEADLGLRHKGSPILVDDGQFDPNGVIDRFLSASRGLPADVAEFVATKLRQHPGYVHQN